MKGSLRRVWWWVRWPLGVLAAAYVVLVIWRVFVLAETEKTAEAVAHIHAVRLTLTDVEKKSLPPVPDEAASNTTLAGIDANSNGIRDDVELAIFAKYPTDKKARAAALQYAKELQMEFTEVYNSETLVAVMEEESRGFFCVGDDRKRKEVEDSVFNTTKRSQFREEIRIKYMTSWGIPNVEECDILS